MSNWQQYGAAPQPGTHNQRVFENKTPYSPEALRPDPSGYGIVTVSGPDGGPPSLGIVAPVRKHVGRIVLAVLLGIGVIAALVVLILMLSFGAVAQATLFALIPLTAVVAAMFWLDRWEPEPLWLLLMALAWGAGVSVLVALVLNTGLGNWLSQATSSDPNLITPVVIAPVVEEGIKGLGLLLIFLFWRRYFDGPIDGIVFGGLIAAGFAFTENILYFAQYIAPYGTAGVTQVFVARAIMSPFAHLIFTAAMGMALGWAARSRSKYSWIAAFPMGYLVAVGLHALWNWSASTDIGLFIGMYMLVQIPLFIFLIVMVIMMRNNEKRIIKDRLTEYGQAGWFIPAEVAMLSNMGGRRDARAWARRVGGDSGKTAMDKFQRGATTLAFQRQRLVIGRAHLAADASEQELLDSLQASRNEMAIALSTAQRR